MIQPLELSGKFLGIVYYNVNGTTSNNQLGDDQIYIDCKPTGEYGEVIDNVSPTNTGDSGMDDDTKNKVLSVVYSLLYVIVGFVFFYFIYYIYKKTSKKIIPTAIAY